MDNFIRKAQVTKVVDGDTFDAYVDLGFTAWVKVRFRLRGIDCPEINSGIASERDRGHLARLRAIELLTIPTNIVHVKSFKSGVYNRWEADVILADGSSLADILIAEGHVK